MKLKIITYNIDGLPTKLDLNTLPWVFRPISWIYKLFKKTTNITINDNQHKEEDTKNIDKFILDEDPDIVAVQEDFNYHNELVSNFYDIYTWGSYFGGFDLSKIFSSMRFFPYPRFKFDGLNIFANYNHDVSIVSEQIIPWKKSYGYFSHGNDLLTTKGFRYYNISINDKYSLGIINLHMDADFYDPIACPDVEKDVEARRSQLNQIYEFINDMWANMFYHPIIILGDTNLYNKYGCDLSTLEEFIENINKFSSLHIEECIPTNYSDCDRIFIINNDHCKYKLELDNIHFKTNINFSDHKPLIAEINITNKQ